jgi:hypothetical protein
MAITCAECGKQFLNVGLHVIYKHKMTIKEYFEKHPELNRHDHIMVQELKFPYRDHRLQFRDYSANQMYDEYKFCLKGEALVNLMKAEKIITSKYCPRKKFRDPLAWNFLVLCTLIGLYREIIKEQVNKDDNLLSDFLKKEEESEMEKDEK